MSEEVLVVVKIPLQPIVEDVKSRNNLAEELFDMKLEGDNLVIFFKKNPSQRPTQVEGTGMQVASRGVVSRLSTITQFKRPLKSETPKGTRQRRGSTRNRMKTRGWQIVAKIVNSKGQTAVVYKPFVEALFGKQLTPAKQRSVVSEILRSNGNDPTEASIEYFLTSTIDYLSQVNKPETGA
jgi:hypothetical protein